MAELEDRLKALLESQPIDGELNIDTIARQLGLDKRGKELLRQTWQNLDEINEKTDDLKKAKKEKGWSTKQWVVNHLWKKMGDMKPEDKAKVIDSIGDQMGKNVQKEVEQAEKEA